MLEQPVLRQRHRLECRQAQLQQGQATGCAQCPNAGAERVYQVGQAGNARLLDEVQLRLSHGLGLADQQAEYQGVGTQGLVAVAQEDQRYLLALRGLGLQFIR